MGKPEKGFFKRVKDLFSRASEPEEPKADVIPVWHEPQIDDIDEHVDKLQATKQPFAHVPFDELD